MQRIKNKNQSDPPHKPMDKLKLIFFYLVALDNPCTNLETNEDDMFLDNIDFYDDTLDEDIISQHLESDLDLLAADKTVTNFDEDDKVLVELLCELKSDQQE